MIRNVHERVINASLEPLGALLNGLGQEGDRLWPSRYWPPMVWAGHWRWEPTAATEPSATTSASTSPAGECGSPSVREQGSSVPTS